MSDEPRNPEHKGLIDSIIDQEIEAAELVNKISGRAAGLVPRLSAVARALVKLRINGKITEEQARAKWGQEYTDQLLADYAEIAPQAVALVDKHLPNQVKEIEKLDRPLGEVGAIRNIDIKARAVEKAKPPPKADE